ncbi:MAG: B12-binding domain-containing radical SAM protein [Brevinematia bacterium]
MQGNYLHILCPPLWERLPPLGPAYLLSFINEKAYFYDLNVRLFGSAPDSMKKKWTIQKELTEEEFFNYFFSNYYGYFEEILNIIERNKIDFAGFSIFNINRTFTLKTINFIKRHFPLLKILLGGPEVFSSYINRLDYPEADYIVVGEGEIPLYKILHKIADNNIFIFEEMKSIDFYPRFEGFDLDLYSRKNSLPIMFGRGCINRCNFCSERLLYKRYKSCNLNLAIEAIEYYIKNYKTKWFTFYDSMLNANLKLFENLMERIIEKKLDIIWDAQIGIKKEMNEEIFYKMKSSGCINLFIGLESGSDTLLKKMGKRFNTSEAREFFKKLNREKIHFEVSLIVGYPDETEVEFQETLTFLKDNITLIPKIAQVSIFKNYPGISARKITRNEELIALKRLEILIDFFEKNNINYTRSYINNLI